MKDTVTRKIVGFKKEESDWLLKFLFEHIGFGGDFQCRVRWKPGTVIVWDVSLFPPPSRFWCLNTELLSI